MILHRIVVVSRQTEVEQLVRRYAREVFMADEIVEAFDIALTVEPELVIFDETFYPPDIRQFLKMTDKNAVDMPVVAMCSSDNKNSQPEEFLEVGAFDYLQHKSDGDSLQKIINQIITNQKKDTSEKDMRDFFINELAASVGIAGCSKSIVDALKMIKLVGFSQCDPVLIVGETGTGKELAAKAIHIIRHPEEQFVAVNCAALTANLLESELFGHVRGSFTGADREKTGLLELAGAGTVFLDEISEMPLDLQPKLLRVLQEKSFRKVGGLESIDCKATLVASSNRDLLTETEANRFRRDLYYRLSVCPIILSPLRSFERKEDIALLAKYFLKTSTISPDKNGKISSLTKFALEVLENYDWPGNVRELRNVIERAILLETTDKIGLSSILINRNKSQRPTSSFILDNIKDFSLAKAECELISRALKETGWQKTKAAALLGITRATLYAKVKQYKIEKKNHSQKPSAVVPESVAVG